MKKLALLYAALAVSILLGARSINAQTWSCTLAPICTPRSEIMAAVSDATGTKLIYVIGGIFGSVSITTTGREVEAYNPVSDAWTCPLAPIPANRPTDRRGIATGANGKIYLLGGQGPTIGNLQSDAVDEYDPVSNSWQTKLHMPTARWFPAAALAQDGSGKIYVFGGESQVSPYALKVVEVYDPNTNSWQQKNPMPGGLSNVRVAPTSNGLIYVFENGGSGTVWEYHPSLPFPDVWVQMTSMPARKDFGATTGPDGKIYVMGGHMPPGSVCDVDVVDVYDPSTDSWNTTVTAPPNCTKRNRIGAVTLGCYVYSIGHGGTHGSCPNFGDPTLFGEIERLGPFSGDCDTCLCFANGDINGDAVTFSVADLIQLAQFVNYGGAPPVPLCKGDMNGDGVIDYGDVETMNCYFTHGLSCFPVYPVPTICDVDTVRGACCDGDSCHIRSLINCLPRARRYLGDGTTCDSTPCWGYICGEKFNDLDGDGFWDSGEPPMGGVSISFTPSVPGVQNPVVTDASGQWCFGPMPNLQYRIYENVPIGKVQTAPSTVYFDATTFEDFTGFNVFGNTDTCATARQHVDTCRAGRNDDYFQDGVELASPSATVCAQLQPGNCSAGPRNTCHPAPGNCSEFDCPGGNMCFGHSFTGCWDSTCTVVHAKLHMKVRASSGGSENDALQLWHNGTWLGNVSFSALNGHWVVPDVLDTWLDLENLTTDLGITNVLAALQGGDLDVIIQDDTEVDFLELVVTTCCNCVTPPDSMVGWWNFDVLATPFRDIAGTVNNAGTYVGSTPAVVGGCIAGALSLHGNDYVNVSDQAELDFGGGNFSIDAWIRTTTTTGLAPIMDKRSGTGLAGSPLLGYSLYLFNGNLGFQMADGAGSSCNCGGGSQCNNYISTVPNIADGLCHHVAVTVNRQAAMGILYVDCAPVLTFTPRLGNIDNSGDLWIGRHHPNPCSPNDAYWVGEIDEVELYNKALSATELATLCNLAGKCKPVVCLCPCWADPQCDGVMSDVLDVVQTINVAFRGNLATTDQECMTQRTDVNCSGATDVIDVVKMINVAFRGANVATEFCNPCP